MQPQNEDSHHKRKIDLKIFKTFALGSLSTTISTVLYQPLDLLKTHRQLGLKSGLNDNARVTSILYVLVKRHGPGYLWRGTLVSLIRSVPGVGLYYTLLHTMQVKFCENNRPNNQIQAFFFGVTSRSIVSLLLMPITVTKVHYESGLFHHRNVFGAIKLVCKANQGWSGTVPTILRDSLFSGTYYASYTSIKNTEDSEQTTVIHNFSCGVVSGVFASVITNPLDFVKTQIQATQTKLYSTKNFIDFVHHFGYKSYFLGLSPRLLRRTLVAATTWTIYEYLNARV